jgi:hypothetical protein
LNDLFGATDLSSNVSMRMMQQFARNLILGHDELLEKGWFFSRHQLGIIRNIIAGHVGNLMQNYQKNTRQE